MSYSIPIPITHASYTTISQYTIHAIGEGASFVDENKCERIGIDMSKRYELLVHDDEGNLVFDFDTEAEDALPSSSKQPVCIRFEVETDQTFLPSAIKLLRSSGPSFRIADQLEFAGETYQGSFGDMIFTEDSGKPCRILFL